MLTERNIEIYEKWRAGSKMVDLAQEYGRSNAVINQICHKTAKHEADGLFPLLKLGFETAAAKKLKAAGLDSEEAIRKALATGHCRKLFPRTFWLKLEGKFGVTVAHEYSASVRRAIMMLEVRGFKVIPPGIE